MKNKILKITAMVATATYIVFSGVWIIQANVKFEELSKATDYSHTQIDSLIDFAEGQLEINRAFIDAIEAMYGQ